MTDKNRNNGSLRPFEKIILFLIPIVFMAVGLCVGRMNIPLGDVLRSVLNRVLQKGDSDSRIDTVVWSMRMPRILLAALVGAGLSVSGLCYQNLFANPLATPDTLGVASGSAFGAALAMLLGADLPVIQLAALACGILAMCLTGLTGLGTGDSDKRTVTPVLAGIMISSLFSSLISLIKFTADTESQLPSITYWLMGGMDGAGYKTLIIGAPPIIICTVILILIRWRMNLLQLSQDEIISSGVNIRRLRLACEFCATLITASAVSMCGQVGWVGLLVPHILRMRYGNNNQILIPASVSLGAAFLILTDTLARTLSAKEIPISILTAIVGAPFFIYLLRKNRGWSL